MIQCGGVVVVVVVVTVVVVYATSWAIYYILILKRVMSILDVLTVYDFKTLITRFKIKI